MEERVCECYAVVKNESDRLLNGVRAWAPPTRIVELLSIGPRSHGHQLSSNACEYAG